MKEPYTTPRQQMFTIILVLGLAVGTSTAHGQWVPPIGIPAPTFGISEVAPDEPSPWNGDVPGFYYVQEGGTNPANGYPGNPRGRIPSTLAAGSVIILAGTYNGNHEDNIIRANGTATQPVYIRGACCADKPTITQKWVVQGSYYIIENVNAKWANSSGNGKLVFEGHHGVVRHMDLEGDTDQGVGALVPVGSNHVIWDNFLHDFGDVKATFDQDNHCIPVGEDTDHLWIVDNEIARCSGDGVQLNAGNAARQSTLHHIYVGRNVLHHHKQTGLWTKQAVDVIFSQNTIYGCRPSNSSSGACMGAQYAPENVWMIYNRIYDGESGIRVEGDSGLGTGSSIYVVGNVIYDITDSPGNADPNNAHASGAIVFRGLRNHYVVNNTLWNYQAGIMSPGDGFLQIENTILGARNNPSGRDIYIESATTANNSVVRNSVFDPAAVRIQWGSGAVYGSLNEFSGATGKGQGSIQANPRFVDIANKDFRLTPSSSAVNTGLTHSVYNIFQQRYGIDISKDVNGTSRPQGGAFDIGAYEFVSTTALQPPAAPSNLVAR
ncbi:MAG: right-handed parallel beta-helix repeat-containing protein [Candidatus Binatia bacterium]